MMDFKPANCLKEPLKWKATILYASFIPIFIVPLNLLIILS